MHLLPITVALFSSSVPTCHDSVTVGHHAQWQKPEFEAANNEFTPVFYCVLDCTVTCEMSMKTSC